MSKQPRVTAAEALRALQRDGWYVDHRRGSHVYLRHPDRPGLVTVPVHAGRTLYPSIVSSILRQAGLTATQFRGLL